MVARDEARGPDLPRAAAQGRTRTVQVPAPRAPAVGQPDARRIWPADEEDRADPLDVPSVRRCMPLPLPDPVEPVRGVGAAQDRDRPPRSRSDEHTSELQSLMRISYAVF